MNPAGRVAGCFPGGLSGYHSGMLILVILVVLALALGVGFVLEGLLWMLLIGVVLLVAAGWFGWSKFRSVGTR